MSLTLLLKLKENMERYHMIKIIIQDIYFMILKAFSITTSDSGGNNISSNGNDLSIIICYI